MRHDVFISFSMQDGENLANRVSKMLKDEFLLNSFIAGKKYANDATINENVRKNINDSKRFLAILTKDTVASNWVKGEISYALRINKEPIICMDQDIDISEVSIELETFSRIEFESPDKLIESLREDVEWGIPVIIPAGGNATGLNFLNFGMPKTLLPVAEKPILHHILEGLDPKLFSKVIILTGRYHKMIEYYVKMIKVELPVICEETSHGNLPMAIKNLSLKSTFMVYYSDIVLEGTIDWHRFIKRHKDLRLDYEVLGTLLCSFSYKLPVAQIKDDGDIPDLIGHFDEKPDNSEALRYKTAIAINLFDPEFLDYINEEDKNLYSDCILKAKNKNKNFGWHRHGEWRHIQTLNDWYDAQKDEYFSDDHKK